MKEIPILGRRGIFLAGMLFGCVGTLAWVVLAGVFKWLVQ